MKELLRGESTKSLKDVVLKCPNAELYLPIIIILYSLFTFIKIILFFDSDLKNFVSCLVITNLTTVTRIKLNQLKLNFSLKSDIYKRPELRLIQGVEKVLQRRKMCEISVGVYCA
jgi:hypothetical protein